LPVSSGHWSGEFFQAGAEGERVISTYANPKLVIISWLLRTFGERQMVAQPIARRWLVSPLINKDFRVCHPLLARSNYASVNLNHQK
jgi:hypothetical protein